jgi:hypothetical protein
VTERARGEREISGGRYVHSVLVCACTKHLYVCVH